MTPWLETTPMPFVINPSRFQKDPLGYAGNQSAHGVIGGAGVMGLLTFGISPALSVALTALLYWVLIELALGQVRIDWIDSLDDTLHVTLGAALFVAIGLSFPGAVFSGNLSAHGVLATWTAYMGLQMWRRTK